MPKLVFPLGALILLLATPVFAQPVVLYTDIESGPNTGGEDNKGTYLSIFGRGFGASRGSSTVTINGTEVGGYKYWGPSNGRPDIQQITVQPGGNVSSGPIRVVVGGEGSNTDLTFTVAEGDIYFVSTTGSQSSGSIGDIDSPFRHCMDTIGRSDFGPGDTLVMRGGTWTDNGPSDPFCLLKNEQGDTVSGTPGFPLMILAYPGEPVLIANGDNAFKLRSQPPDFPVHDIVIAGFDINTDSASITTTNWSKHIRIVNNECWGLSLTGQGTGAVGGHGQYNKYLGNHVYDVGENKLYHNIYLSNGHARPAGDNELAWNYIHHNRAGRGIQMYNGSDSAVMVNNSVHDNVIHDIDERHAISFGNSTSSGMKVYNNVIFDSANGVRPNSNDGLEVEIYNNTFFNVDAAIDLDECSSVTLRNNVVVIGSGLSYFDQNLDACPTSVVNSSHNLWFGNGAAPAWDEQAYNVDPMFVDPGSRNFRLQSSSPAIDAGMAIPGLVSDHFGATRPQGDALDLGAVEHDGPVVPPSDPPLPPSGVSVQ